MSTSSLPPTSPAAFGWKPTRDSQFWGAKMYQKQVNGSYTPEQGEYVAWSEIDLSSPAITGTSDYIKGTKFGWIEVAIKIAGYIPGVSIGVGVYHIVVAHKNGLENKWLHTARGAAEILCIAGIALFLIDLVATLLPNHSAST